MSPILTRPVREQLEHDRVIRQLQARYKRKNDVIINPGNEQNQSVTVGDLVVFPDAVLFAEGTRRIAGTVEVETGESVNPIEARAEWGVYSKLKVPLHLYVPPTSVDAVKRIAAEYQILISELWTYTTTFDQVRFTMVFRSPDAPVVKPATEAEKAKAAKMAQAEAKAAQAAALAAEKAAEKAAAAAAAEKAAAALKAAEQKIAAKPAPKAAKTIAKPAPVAKPAAVAKPAPIAKPAPKPVAKPAAKAAPAKKLVAKAKPAASPAKPKAKAKPAAPKKPAAKAKPAAKKAGKKRR